jgi:hypothetical protein
MSSTRSRRSLFTAALETLEQRRLLAADLQLDADFNDDGVATLDYAIGDYETVNDLLFLGDSVYAFGGGVSSDLSPPQFVNGLGVPNGTFLYQPPNVPTSFVIKTDLDGNVDTTFGMDGRGRIGNLPGLQGYVEFEQAPGADTVYVSRLDGFGEEASFSISRLTADLQVDPSFQTITIPLQLDTANIATNFDYGFDFDVDSFGNVTAGVFGIFDGVEFARTFQYDDTGSLQETGFVSRSAVTNQFQSSQRFVSEFGFRGVGALDDGNTLISFAVKQLEPVSGLVRDGTGGGVVTVGPSGSILATSSAGADVDGSSRYRSFHSSPDGRWALEIAADEGEVEVLSSQGLERLSPFRFTSSSSIPFRLEDVVFTEDGGIRYLTGSSGSADPFPGGTSADVYIVQESSNPALGYVYEFDGMRLADSLDQYAVGRSAALAPDGSVYVGGTLINLVRNDVQTGAPTDPLRINSIDPDAAIWRFAEPAVEADYTELDGLVTIEANEPSDGFFGTVETSWDTIIGDDLINGEGVMAFGDDDFNARDTLDGDRLDYTIDFETAGTYYVWLRMAGEDFRSDSVHVGLNGDAATFGGFGLAAPVADGSYQWVNFPNPLNNLPQRVQIEVTEPGVQTLNLWVREEGVMVDEIRVSNDPNYVPTETATPNVAPTIGSLTVSPNPVFASSVITLTANGVDDVDGTVEKVVFETVNSDLIASFVLEVDADGSDGFSTTVNLTDLVLKSPTFEPRFLLPGDILTFKATAEDDDGALGEPVFLSVLISEPVASGPQYDEVNGLVEIEAASPTTDAADAAAIQWQSNANINAIGDLELVTSDNVGFNSRDNLTGDVVEYDITFATPGTYYVWVRMAGETFRDDSVHVAFDGNPVTFGGFGLAPPPENAGTGYQWVNEPRELGRRVTVEVTEPGTYSLGLYIREDGVRVDEIRLSNDPNYDPAEPQENQAPTINSLAFNPDPYFVGQPLTVQAVGVEDVDGTVVSVEFSYVDLTNGQRTVVVDDDPSDGFSATFDTLLFLDRGTPSFRAVATDDDGAESDVTFGRVFASNVDTNGRAITELTTNPTSFLGDEPILVEATLTGDQSDLLGVAFFAETVVRDASVIKFDTDGSDGYSAVIPADFADFRSPFIEVYAIYADGAVAKRATDVPVLISRPFIQEDDGVYAIDAFSRTFERGFPQFFDGPAWVQRPDSPDAIDGRELTTATDTGFNSGDTVSGDAYTYVVDFTTTGTHYIWVRMAGDGFRSDSVHVGLNGQPATLGGFGLAGPVADGQYRWANGVNPLNGLPQRVQVQITETGTQELNLWIREDGVRVDEIRLSNDPDYNPSFAATTGFATAGMDDIGFASLFSDERLVEEEALV